MAHAQMFKACDNEDGYIAVIVHREKYAKALEKIGFVDSTDKLKKAEPAPVEPADPKPTYKSRSK